MTLFEAEQKISYAGYRQKAILNGPIEKLKPNHYDLSIIVPVYNSEDYLPTCLASLVNQNTDYEYEIICINDGSTDNSKSILYNFSLHYPKIKIFSQDNQGISIARNTGIQLAEGEYIGFVDNDDWVENNYVQNLIFAAKKNDADIVQCGYDRVSPSGKIYYSHFGKGMCISKEDYCSNYDNIRGTIWGGCYRKNIFNKIRFPENYWYEDMINKVILIRLTNRIVSLEPILYHWLARHSSAMSTYWKSSEINCLDQIYLPIRLEEYAESVLQLPAEEIYKNALAHEWGYILYLRTHKLKRNLRKCVFTIAKSLLLTNNIFNRDKYLPSNHKNFEIWNTICLFHFILEETKKRIIQ